MGLHRQIEQYLYMEAKLMDDGEYDRWLQCYSEEAVYWIPTWDSDTELAQNPSRDTSLIYWGLEDLQRYVYRLTSGNAHFVEPRPRTTRYMHNIMIGEKIGDQQTVYSKWLMQDVRRGVQQFFGGDCEHILSMKDDRVMNIAYKKVTIKNDAILSGSMILL